MDASRWERLWEIFEAGLAQAPGQREAWVQSACGGDLELRREVASLLAAHGAGSDAPDEAVREAMAGAAMTGPGGAGEPPDPAGGRIGPYEIARVLGRGGMGVVYLAVRADDEYRRQVAIKVVRGGLHSPELIRRFLAERQILADLDHPGIARLLDGGTTSEGFPYVVMEYIEGETIDRYCDRRRLTVAARLALFRQVCGAVQSAHASLVVHRDIKPANILVTAAGLPKLLDFGIAKLLGPAAPPGAAVETGTAMRLLTPDYASPEQIRGTAITTASDVYSLGVLLYELLTGRRPHRLERRTPGEIERAICETAPERPSAAAGRHEEPAPVADAAGPVAVAAARGTTPQRLRRLLAGDLDNILLMALRKEPERRYASADRLSEDIRRHLAGLPVIARHDTWIYRTRKFAGRHALGVATAGVIIAVLAGFAVSVVHQRDRALAAEAAAAREADKARMEARTARRVADFLVELFEVNDPDQARGRVVTAQEILAKGSDRIARELAEEPAVRARIMNTIARVYQNLGLYEEAAGLARQGLAARQGLHGAGDPEVAESLQSLGSIASARGAYPEAEGHLLAALRILRERGNGQGPLLIQTLNSLGVLRDSQGRYDEARAAFEEALALAREEHGPRHEVVATCTSNLGQVRKALGEYVEAERLQRETLAMREQILPPDHPDIATSLSALGQTLVLMGRLDDAEELLRRNVAMNRRIFAPGHPRVALSLNELSSVLKQKGRPAEAETLQQEAYRIFVAAHGESHPIVALCLNNLANLRHDQGDYEAAETLHRRSLALARRLYGAEHPNIADSLNNLGNLLWDVGDYDRAAPMFRQALAIDRKLLGDPHPYVAMDMHALAMALDGGGRREEAEKLYREAIAMNAGLPGADAVSTATYEGSLGLMLVRQGRAREGEPLLRGSLAAYEKLLPADHWQIHQARGMLGRGLAALGRFDEAEPLVTESLKALIRIKGERTGATRRAREHLQAFHDARDRHGRSAAGPAAGQGDGH